MTRKAAASIAGVAIVAALAVGSVARSETDSAKGVITSTQDIKWAAAPASLPCCAEAALLYGDPAKEGLFALRVRIPKDYYIPPHTHPNAEVVTVLTGKFSLGMGPKADRASARPIGAGGFMAMPPQTPHYVFSDEETVLQITSVGPWGIDYVDPKDDPRLNIAPVQKGGSAQRQE
ncbi:MAG: cupin domain-containing protein [Methylocystis sp.]|uniref:cupin domain-containing protein n=1 Tax=Methylocystis sp. TaxID=1911079 RepID=UPI003DA66D21